MFLLGLNIITQSLVYNIYIIWEIYQNTTYLIYCQRKCLFLVATQWLKNPHPEFDGKALSDLMKEGEIKAVYAQLEADINAKKKNG